MYQYMGYFRGGGGGGGGGKKKKKKKIKKKKIWGECGCEKKPRGG
jgi:hypothetical protein